MSKVTASTPAIVLAALLTIAAPAPAQQAPAPGHAAPAPAQEKLGQVQFPVSCAPAVQKDFERAVALLHSFWYTAAVKAFTGVADADPSCAMAHWGVAMSWWYPLWEPPSPSALKQGWTAVERAKAIGARTDRERDYVAAIEAFYKDADRLDHRTRALAYARAFVGK
jgi:hypothetical protein